MSLPHRDARPRISAGIDLVAIEQVAEALARHGERYEHRLFRAEEIRYCRAAPLRTAERYAARFAAKEATVKALRLGDDAGFDWRDIEVHRAESGACELALHGRVREHAEALGVFSLAVSLTHEGGFAAATVTALADH